MKRFSSLTIICLLFLLILSGCAPAQFTGDETVNANRFSLDFTQLSGTKSHEMQLGKGAIVDVIIIKESGRLDIKVSTSGGETVYQADDADSTKFSLIIQKEDTYKFSVTGKNAAGQVSFTVYP